MITIPCASSIELCSQILAKGIFSLLWNIAGKRLASKGFEQIAFLLTDGRLYWLGMLLGLAGAAWFAWRHRGKQLEDVEVKKKEKEKAPLRATSQLKK